MIENNDNESDDEAIQDILGKERCGALRCYGRTVTRTSFKRNVEIDAIKKAHGEEVTSLHDKLHGMEDKLGRLQFDFKALFQHCNPGIDMELLEDLLGSSPGNSNSVEKESGQPNIPSSTSTHVPNSDGKHYCEF